MEKLKVLDVDCSNCAKHVTDALDGVQGIAEVDVRLEEKIAVVTYDPGQITRQVIEDKLADVGYDIV